MILAFLKRVRVDQISQSDYDRGQIAREPIGRKWPYPPAVAVKFGEETAFKWYSQDGRVTTTGRYILLDGNHRLRRALELGRKTIPLWVAAGYEAEVAVNYGDLTELDYFEVRRRIMCVEGMRSYEDIRAEHKMAWPR